MMWKNELHEIAGPIPFIIIDNKVDLQADQRVPLNGALNLSATLGAVNLFETSARTGEGVEEAFKLLAIKTHEYYIQ